MTSYQDTALLGQVRVQCRGLRALVAEKRPRKPVGSHREGRNLAGVLLVGIASGIYLTANLGAGPRDGLMTGVAADIGMVTQAFRPSVVFM